MTELIRKLTKKNDKNLPKFSPGDTVNVFVKVKEGDKERTQVFKGVVLKLQGAGSSRSFTVRKTSFGVGVERTFPLQSSVLEGIEVVSHGKTRRAKLYYLRKLAGRAATLESELAFGKPETATEETKK